MDKPLVSSEEPNRRGGETFESEEEDDSSQPAGSQHRTADERWLQRSLTRTQFHKLNTTAAPSQEKERESTWRARERPTDTTIGARASATHALSPRTARRPGEGANSVAPHTQHSTLLELRGGGGARGDRQQRRQKFRRPHYNATSL